VKYELGFYIPEDDIIHSHRREHLKSYSQLWAKNTCRMAGSAKMSQCFCLLPTTQVRRPEYFDTEHFPLPKSCVGGGF
jgi:hypothetical protein